MNYKSNKASYLPRFYTQISKVKIVTCQQNSYLNIITFLRDVGRPIYKGCATSEKYRTMLCDI